MGGALRPHTPLILHVNILNFLARDKAHMIVLDIKMNFINHHILLPHHIHSFKGAILVTNNTKK
jgi:hypothetical protein